MQHSTLQNLAREQNHDAEYKYILGAMMARPLELRALHKAEPEIYIIQQPRRMMCSLTRAAPRRIASACELLMSNLEPHHRIKNK